MRQCPFSFRLLIPATGVILLAMLLFSCHEKSLLVSVTDLPHYPSASAVEKSGDRIYVLGDDATHLMVLDSNLAAADSVLVFTYPEKRISKAVKPDWEAVCRLPGDSLLFLGSGSLYPQRYGALLFDTRTKKTDSLRLDTLYNRIRQQGVPDLNIEGLCRLPGSLVLASRGNGKYRKNNLILLPENALWRQQSAPISLLRIGYNTDSTSFQGVSGMAYSLRSDKLLLTVSTEATNNSIDDGAIGKSFLWVVDHFSNKRGWRAVNPNRIIDLEKADPRFRGQKMESVCILRETPELLHLLLAADNDNGQSRLFTLMLEKD